VQTHSAPPRRSRRGTFESLRVHHNYRLYFVGQIVSYSGSFVQETALPWMVLERTHSPVLVGLLVFCHYGPFAVLGLYGGVVADRFDNRRVLVATQGAAMAVAILLTIVAFAGSAPLWIIYVLAVGSGVALAFDNPSKFALIYQLVGRAEVSNAIGLNITMQNAAKIVGPAVGGVVIAAFGVGWCFLLNAASYLAVLAGLLLIRRAQLFRLDCTGEKPPPLLALREGFAYMRDSRELQALMGLAVAFGLFGFSALKALLSVLAAETLQSGAETFGILSASYGAGAVLGGLVSASFGQASWRRLFVGAAGFSGGIVMLAPVHSAVLAGLLLVLIGAAWTTWAAEAQSISVLSAPDHLRGRVMSLYVGSLLVGVPVGGLLGGWLAAAGGTALAFSVSGAAGLAATGLAATSLRAPAEDAPERIRASEV
jgi:MFS family permease